jgi:hypothetical protein
MIGSIVEFGRLNKTGWKLPKESQKGCKLPWKYC